MHLKFLFLLAMVCSTTHVVFTATIYVDSNSTTPADECGVDLSTACRTIADGFTVAGTGDTVELQPGIYSGSGNENLQSTNFSASQLIVTGSTGNPDDVVVFCSTSNRFLSADRHMYSEMRDFTIRNCTSLATTPLGIGDGGALLMTGVVNAVLFENMVFFGNKARSGGALFVEGGSVTLSGCLLQGNEAQYWGGAVSYVESGLTVENTRMIGNRAHGDLGDSVLNVDTDQAGKGGAIHGNGGARLTLQNAEFAMNAARLSGGSVFLNLVSGASILHSTFSSNGVYGGEACSSDQVCQVRGGAIYVKDVAVTLTNSSFIANTAVTQDLSEYAEGGAIVFASDVFSTDRIESFVSNCSFVNNSARGAEENNAGGYGGAILSRGIPVSIESCSFTGNFVQSEGLFSEYASGGGAVFIAASTAGEILNSEFSRNYADGGRAGAVYITESSVILLRNNTFYLNAAYSSYVVKAQGGAVGIALKSEGQVEACRFLNNFAAPKTEVYPKTFSGFGGAIFVQSSSGSITDCYFMSNTASSGQFDSGGQGGGIAMENVRDFLVDHSVFALNSARGFYGTNSYSSSGSGGAVCLLFSSGTFANCIFVDNFASAGGSQYSLGGGVAIFYEYDSTEDDLGPAPLTFSNCDFVRNVAGGEMCSATPVYRAGQGGGIGIIGVSKEDVIMNYTTFENNMALTESEGLVSSYGGALMYAQGSSVICNECIFYKNIAWNGLGDDVCSGFDDVSYSTRLDLKLSEPILNSATDMEAFKIHERFNLLKAVFCTVLGQNLVDGASLSTMSPMSEELREALSLHEREVQRDHSEWAEMSRRHMAILNAVEGINVATRESLLYSPGSSDLSEQIVSLEEDPLGVVSADSYSRRRLKSLTSRIYPSMLFLSGSASIYLPVYNNSYEICVGDLISIIVGLTEGTSTSSISSTGVTPTLTVIGSINSSDLMLIGISANITVVDQSTRESVALRSLGLLNSTFYFSNNISVDMGGAFIGSTLSSYVPPTVSNVTISKSYMPILNMLGDVYTGVSSHGGDIDDAAMGIISLLQRTTHEPFTILQRCTLRIYGRLFLSTVSSNSSNVRTVTMTLVDNSTLVMTKGAELYSESPAEIVAESPQHVALVNFGTMFLAGSKPSYLHPLQIYGVLIQFDPGMLIFSLSNNDYNTPALIASTNVSLLGTINITAAEGTEYTPSSDSDEPTAWVGIQYTAVASSRDDNNVTRYIYPDGIFFDEVVSSDTDALSALSTNSDGASFGEHSYLDSIDLQSEASLASRAMSSSGISAAADGYSQVFTTSSMSCEQRYSSYTTDDRAGDSDYMCHICLLNHTCGYCGTVDGCISKGDSCPSGAFKKKDSNCCPQMCNDHGKCMSSDKHTSFECKCEFFWAGNSCSSLSVATYLLIAAGVFLVVIALITLRYYYYYRQQKKKVLQELRVGLLDGGTTNGGSENRSYLQAIQQDLILRDVFVNYDEIVFEGKIGEGSFGEVFKASFRGAQVAVKQMRAPVFMQLTENDIEEFRTEAYMMSRLRHPNIVLVMGVSIVELALPGPPPGFEDDDDMGSARPGSDDKDKRTRSLSRAEKKEKEKPKVVRSVCIITEYLEQGSLADILYGSNKVADDIWTYELVLTCALQAARGMLYLHSHQPPICHRDLKSSNLVVDDHWVVKVTDFGMSRIVPMKIQNIEKGIEKSNSVDLMGGQIDRSDILAASLAAEVARGDLTIDEEGGKEDDSPKKSVTINEEANVSWERESIVNPEEGERHSMSNSMMTSNLGTTAWCAPELLTATTKARYSVKVDVYSFGMVLWELWERKRPYEELYSRFDIIDAVREGRRPAISSTCPPTFRSLIQRCWHEQPARRPTFAYIVRYIKDELAHIKRQRMSSASTFSPLHHLLLGGRTKSSGSGTSNSAASPNAPSASENSTSSPSVDSGEEKSRDWLNTQSAPPVVEEHVQPEHITSRATISYMPPSHLPPAPLAIPQKPSRENLDMLASSPWASGGEDVPSGVTQAQSHQSAPPGGAVNRAWREKYVMKFNGWKSSQPDAGLPPSVYGSSKGVAASGVDGRSAAAVAAPAQSAREGGDSPESRSQESSVDSSSDENQQVRESTLPAQSNYELDLYSSSSSISPEDLPRLPAARASDTSSGRDSRASGGTTSSQKL